MLYNEFCKRFALHFFMLSLCKIDLSIADRNKDTVRPSVGQSMKTIWYFDSFYSCILVNQYLRHN